MIWEDIPFDTETPDEIKALEFDMQYVENGGDLTRGPDDAVSIWGTPYPRP